LPMGRLRCAPAVAKNSLLCDLSRLTQTQMQVSAFGYLLAPCLLVF
jgi:hypothetical protein